MSECHKENKIDWDFKIHKKQSDRPEKMLILTECSFELFCNLSQKNEFFWMHWIENGKEIIIKNKVSMKWTAILGNNGRNECKMLIHL